MTASGLGGSGRCLKRNAAPNPDSDTSRSVSDDRKAHLFKLFKSGSTSPGYKSCVIVTLRTDVVYLSRLSFGSWILKMQFIVVIRILELGFLHLGVFFFLQITIKRLTNHTNHDVFDSFNILYILKIRILIFLKFVILSVKTKFKCPRKVTLSWANEQFTTRFIFGETASESRRINAQKDSRVLLLLTFWRAWASGLAPILTDSRVIRSPQATKYDKFISAPLELFQDSSAVKWGSQSAIKRRRLRSVLYSKAPQVPL